MMWWLFLILLFTESHCIIHIRKFCTDQIWISVVFWSPRSVFSNTESWSLSVGIEGGLVGGNDRESESNCEWVDRLLEELTRGEDLINILDLKLNQRNSKVNELNSRMGQTETKVTEVDRKVTQLESRIKWGHDFLFGSNVQLIKTKTENHINELTVMSCYQSSRSDSDDWDYSKSRLSRYCLIDVETHETIVSLRDSLQSQRLSQA
jgi:hypothetical protein